MNDPITYSALPEDLGGIEGEAIPEPAVRGDGAQQPVLAPTRLSDGGARLMVGGMTGDRELFAMHQEGGRESAARFYAEMMIARSRAAA